MGFSPVPAFLEKQSKPDYKAIISNVVSNIFIISHI